MSNNGGLAMTEDDSRNLSEFEVTSLTKGLAGKLDRIIKGK